MFLKINILIFWNVKIFWISLSPPFKNDAMCLRLRIVKIKICLLNFDTKVFCPFDDEKRFDLIYQPRKHMPLRTCICVPEWK